MNHFKDLPDPRQAGKVIYPLGEVLLLCLLAVLDGAESFVDIALFGEKKLNLLRRFLPYRDGTPSHDQLGDIFATLDAVKFQHCFVAWVASFTGAACGFRGKAATNSDGRRPGIPIESGHPIRTKAATLLRG